MESADPLKVLTLPAGIWSEALRDTDATVQAFVPLIELALASGGAVALPSPGPSGWVVEMISADDSLVFQVRNPAGRVALVAAAAHGAGPIAQGAWDRIASSCRRRFRPDLVAGIRRPEGPWLVESLGNGLRGWWEEAVWLPSFSRAIAWCWLEGRVWTDAVAE